jgi:hypothetical protein
MKDAVSHLPRYVEQLERLTFPRDRLSLGVLEGDSRDGTFEAVRDLEPRLRQRFHRVGLFKRDHGFRMPPGIPRWETAFQLARRSILARARNNLLLRALDDEDWVLWLDVDVIDYPDDIIERLLAYELPILHPHCVVDAGGRSFDLNAWAGPDAKPMDTMRGSGQPVRLDAVGGTMLLVKADLHRDGLVFPPYRYGAGAEPVRRHPIWEKGEIETEGLALMARDMGVQCWGLPDLEIMHRNG